MHWRVWRSDPQVEKKRKEPLEKKKNGAAEDTGSEPTRLRDKARGSEVFLRAPVTLVSR